MIPNVILHSRRELETISHNYAAAISYPDNKLLCRLLGKYLAFVDTRDLMLAPRLAIDGYWEPWVTLAIARHLQPGMHCVDVGANYGYYTLLMADGAGPTGRVAACEPLPGLAQDFLPKNLHLNAFFSGVEIVEKAISDRDGDKVSFVVHGFDFAVSSMEKWSYDRERTALTVETATIDAICRDWPRVDLIKVDAEGADLLVWRGMQATLKRNPQAVVVAEVHLLRDPAETVAYLKAIQEAGYPLRTIDYNGDVGDVKAAAILEAPNEHWTLWLHR